MSVDLEAVEARPCRFNTPCDALPFVQRCDRCQTRALLAEVRAKDAELTKLRIERDAFREHYDRAPDAVNEIHRLGAAIESLRVGCRAAERARDAALAEVRALRAAAEGVLAVASRVVADNREGDAVWAAALAALAAARGGSGKP